MSRGRGVLVFAHSYLLAEDNGPGNSISANITLKNRWRNIEVESGPVTANSSLERAAVRIDGDDAALVREGILHIHSSTSARGLRLVAPSVGLDIIHKHTSRRVISANKI